MFLRSVVAVAPCATVLAFSSAALAQGMDAAVHADGTADAGDAGSDVVYPDVNCNGLTDRQCECRRLTFQVVLVARREDGDALIAAELRMINSANADAACAVLAQQTVLSSQIEGFRSSLLASLDAGVEAGPSPDWMRDGGVDVSVPAEIHSLMERASLVASLPDEASGASAANGSLAAPSVEPVQFASESMYLSMTRMGPRTIFSAAINPMALIFPATAGFLRRLGDISITAPINTQQLFGASTGATSLPAPWNVVDYIGTRLRLNFLGAFDDDGTSSTRFRHVIDRLEAERDLFERRLQQSEAVRRDTIAYVAQPEVRVVQEWIDYIAELDALRRRAPRYYAGLDIRYDSGNPNFASGNGVLAHSVMWSAAGGWTSGGEGGNAGIRARLGGQSRVTIPIGTAMSETRHYLDFGLALMIARSAPWLSAGAAQKMTFNLGLEGRVNGDCSSSRPDGTDCLLDVRIAANLPLTNGNSLGVGLAIPAINGGPVMLTLSGSLAQLMGLSDPIALGTTRPAN